jgi:O-antigen/teichoic acid export membrane protein
MTDKKTYNFLNHFVRGAVHYGFWGSITRILVFLNVFVVLAMVTPYQYGVYKLAFSIFIMANELLISGLNSLVLNDISQYHVTNMLDKASRLMREFVVIRLVLGVLSAIAFYFGAHMIALYYSESIATYIKLFSILFITDALITCADIFFKSKLDFFGSNISSFVNELTKIITLLYFLLVVGDGIDIWKLSLITFIGSVVSAMVVIVYLLYKYRPKLNFQFSGKWLVFHLLRTYGKWAIAKNYISSFTDNARLWLIKLFISTEAVAIFSVAVSMVNFLKKMIPTQSLSSLIPRHAKDFKVLSDIYQRVTKYSIWSYALMLVFGLFLVSLTVPIIFPKYVDSVQYFNILIFAICFNAMVLNKQIIYSLRRQVFLFVLPVIECLSTLLIGSILLFNFGLIGISVELLITELIIFTVIYQYLIRIYSGFRFNWKNVFSFDQSDKDLIVKIWYKIIHKIQI